MKRIIISSVFILLHVSQSGANINLNHIKPGDVVEFNEIAKIAVLDISSIKQAKENCPRGITPSPKVPFGSTCIPRIKAKQGMNYKVLKVIYKGCYKTQNQGAQEVCEISLQIKPLDSKKETSNMFYYVHFDPSSDYPDAFDFKITKAAARSDKDRCNLFLQRIYSLTSTELKSLDNKREIALLSKSRRYTQGDFSLDECKSNLEKIKVHLLKAKPMIRSVKKITLEMNSYFYDPESKAPPLQ